MSNVLPSLRQLRYLVAIAERLNFTQAAQDCFVTQSTLSSGLKELETLLGARLVERDRQSVRMTPLGARVVERSRALLGSAQDLVDFVRASAAPMTGTLRLGAIPTIAPFLLPGLVRRTHVLHPALTMLLREDRTAVLLERLRAGELDFALIALPYDTTGLLVRELFTEELWLIRARPDGSGDGRIASAAADGIAAPDGREADRATAAGNPGTSGSWTSDGGKTEPGTRPSIGDLDPERLLLLEEGHCLREHTIEACGLAERANPSGIEATSLVTLVQMVESELGDALLPQMAIDSTWLAGAAIQARRFAAPAPTRQIALVARTSTTRTEEFGFLADLAGGFAPR